MSHPSTPVRLTKQQIFALLPPRAPHSHKGSYGRVVCLCGCPAYRGAALLACLGALRTGAGIVALAAQECVVQAVAPRAPEAVFVPLPDDDALSQALRSCTVALGGCGKHADDKTAMQMKTLLEIAQGTVVLDAGGLVSLAGERQALRHAAGRLIVTPHIGEMAALTQSTPAQVQQDSERLALSYAQDTGAVVVLKSHRTLIATPDGALYENTTGNAGLARGGSGDLLAGMLAGLAATGLAPLQAALCGVFLHGAAADACAARLSMQGMLPEDILQDVCNLFLENERNL